MGTKNKNKNDNHIQEPRDVAPSKNAFSKAILVVRVWSHYTLSRLLLNKRAEHSFFYDVIDTAGNLLAHMESIRIR